MTEMVFFTDESGTRLPPVTSLETRKVEFADVDGDQDPDIFLSNVAFIPGRDAQNRLFINNGSGVFTDQSGLRLPQENEHTVDGIFIDIDLDTRPDIVSANVFNKPYRVYMNNGQGIFSEQTLSVFPPLSAGDGLGVLASDFNMDGFQDLYLCDRGGQDRLLFYLPQPNDLEQEAIEGAAIKVYPNPVRTTLSVEVEVLHGNPMEVNLSDHLGRLVWSKEILPLGKGTQLFQIPVTGLASGLYRLFMVKEGKEVRVKVSVF